MKGCKYSQHLKPVHSAISDPEHYKSRFALWQKSICESWTTYPLGNSIGQAQNSVCVCVFLGETWDSQWALLSPVIFQGERCDSDYGKSKKKMNNNKISPQEETYTMTFDLAVTLQSEITSTNWRSSPGNGFKDTSWSEEGSTDGVPVRQRLSALALIFSGYDGHMSTKSFKRSSLQMCNVFLADSTNDWCDAQSPDAEDQTGNTCKNSKPGGKKWFVWRLHRAKKWASSQKKSRRL